MEKKMCENGLFKRYQSGATLAKMSRIACRLAKFGVVSRGIKLCQQDSPVSKLGNSKQAKRANSNFKNRLVSLFFRAGVAWRYFGSSHASADRLSIAS